MSPNAQTAWDQFFTVLASMGIAGVLAVVAYGISTGFERRSRIRIRVRHLDSRAGRKARRERADKQLNDGLAQLRGAVLAAIPQQRRGGEPDAR